MELNNFYVISGAAEANNITPKSRINLKSCCIPKRYVFAVMGFFATLIGFMQRESLDLTISYMVNETVSLEPARYDPHSCPHLNVAVNQSDMFFGPAQNITIGTINWNAEQQSSVSSIYHTAYGISQIIGGLAADSRGGKRLLCGSLLVSSVAMFVLPFASKWFKPTVAVVLRFITGFANGIILPVLASMMSKWVPQDAKAFVACIIFPGTLIGHVAAAYIAHPLILIVGWEAVYYTFGLLGFAWAGVWVFTGYNSPNDHPNITKGEKDYLNKSSVALIRSTKYDLDPFPWKAQMKCVPMIACIAGYVGREWAFSTLTTQIPQFIKDVLRFDISQSNGLSFQPYVCMWIFSLIFGFVSDVLVLRGCCTVNFVRKLSTSIAAIGSALCIVLIAYSGCNAVLAIFWMFLGMIMLGAYYSGVMINMLDITPNYAGTMVAMVDNIAYNVVGLVPMLNKLIITDSLLYQWRISLWIVFCIIMLSLTMFLYFVKTDEMWWDDVRRHGYPTNWTSGLLPTGALIGENGETVFKPRKDVNTTAEK